jgi:hypothetical protein
MPNPQYTLTVALGVGAEGLKRREAYEKAAGGKPLSQWVREVLDKAANKSRGSQRAVLGDVVCSRRLE